MSNSWDDDIPSIWKVIIQSCSKAPNSLLRFGVLYPLVNVYITNWKIQPFSSWVNPLFLWMVFLPILISLKPTSTNLPHLPTSDRPGPLGPLGVSWVLGPRPGGRTRASWGTCPAADRCGTARGTSRRGARTARASGTEDPGPWRPGFCPKKEGVLKIYRDLSGFNGNIMGKHRL